MTPSNSQHWIKWQNNFSNSINGLNQQFPSGRKVGPLTPPTGGGGPVGARCVFTQQPNRRHVSRCPLWAPNRRPAHSFHHCPFWDAHSPLTLPGLLGSDTPVPDRRTGQNRTEPHRAEGSNRVSYLDIVVLAVLGHSVQVGEAVQQRPPPRRDLFLQKHLQLRHLYMAPPLSLNQRLRRALTGHSAAFRVRGKSHTLHTRTGKTRIFSIKMMWPETIKLQRSIAIRPKDIL